jgi:hypothetical protein
MPTNMHAAPAEGNFCDQHRNAIKPATVANYNKHMGYLTKSTRWQTVSGYSVSRWTWKWRKKLFFHFLILASFILLSSCGMKLSHWDFHLTLVQNMLEHTARGLPHPQCPMGQLHALSTTISCLEEANRHHWPTFSAKRMNCCVCSSRGMRSNLAKSKKCNVGLWILKCFEKYHTNERFT